MDRNNIGFFISSGLLVAGYFWINSHYAAQNPQPHAPAIVASAPQIPGTPATPPSSQTPIQAATVSATTPSPNIVTPTPVKPEDLQFDLGKLSVSFTQTGGCFASTKLNGYKASLKGEDPAELFANHQICKAYGIKVGRTDLRDKPAAIARTSENRIEIVQNAEGLEVKRVFEFEKNSYKSSFSVEVRNLTETRQTVPVLVELGARSEIKGAGGTFSSKPLEHANVEWLADDSVSLHALPFEENPSPKVIAAPVKIQPKWIASGSMYFFNALLPKHKDPLNLLAQRTGTLIQSKPGADFDQTVYEAWVEHPVELESKATKTFAYDLYLGPKTKSELDQFKDQQLDKSIDYGFFSVVAWPLFYAMTFIEKLVGNWGIAIIILTAIVKTILYPLALKSYIAGKKMQKMQPQIKALQEKYKDDKQKLNQEMMALMSQSGANPLSGCLPILPQLPIFFGLFSVFQQTADFRHAPFALWIKDLSVMDPYFVLPILMVALYVVQQRVTPTPPNMDPMQKKMMQFLPFIFSFMMITFPSGLVLYFVTNTILSIAQQVYMMRKYEEV